MEKYFSYLEDLRDSGVTNMWGAVPYLEKEFPELSHKEAGDILIVWINKKQEECKNGKDN